MDLKKKLKELKPQQLNCNVFDVYSYNGLTMQDLLCQFFTTINECVKSTNEVIDLTDWLVNIGLEEEVVKKLMVLIEDGTVEELINVNLFKTLNEKINGLSSQLEQKANGNEVVKKGYGNLNDFDEPTRKAILENNSIDINYVLGEGNVGLENTNYIEVERYNYLDKNILDTNGFIGADGNIVSYDNVKTSKKYVKLKPNTTYSTNANWNGGLYNKNLVFTRQLTSSNMTFTTTTEEVYARFSFSYEEGNELTNYYWAMLVEGSKTLVKEDYIDYHVIKKAIPNNIAYENMIKEITSNAITNNSKWNSKIWNCLGDSITYGYGSSETYHKIIGEEKGFSLVRNYGISGSTIAYVDNELAINPPNGSPMCNRFNEMDDNADLISVMALTNDAGWRVPLGTMEDRTDRTFYGACHILFRGLNDKYWDKTIFAMTSTPRDSDALDNTLMMLPYVEAFKEVCQYYSIPCLDLFSISGFKVNNENFKAKYMPDGLHPNAEGYKLLANIIGNFIDQL